MIQSIEQLPLGLRLQTLKESVLACRARKEQDEAQEAEYLDMLAKAEAEVTGKAPGYEGVELTGLITDNPYQATHTPPADEPPPEEPAEKASE